MSQIDEGQVGGGNFLAADPPTLRSPLSAASLPRSYHFNLTSSHSRLHLVLIYKYSAERSFPDYWITETTLIIR